MHRKLLTILGAATIALVVSAAALPWWLGAALGWAGAAQGLKFARYERIGYSRFALHEVEVRRAAVRITGSRMEADTPLVAWWRRGEITLAEWQVEVVGGGHAAAVPPTASGWVPLRETLRGVALQLGRWAPRITARSGAVRWPGTEMTCASATWAERVLAAKGVSYRGVKADATLTFSTAGLQLALRGARGGMTAGSRGGDVRGVVTWGTQRASLTAHFGRRGWLPLDAALVAADWTVPAETLRLGAAYAAVRGHAKIEWRERTLLADLDAKCDPVKEKSVPPLEVAMRGRGDLEAFTVESLHATLPGIAVRLIGAVAVERSGKFRPGGARFTVDADLAKVPWFAAKGLVTGEARLGPDPGLAPTVEFQLTMRDVAVADWAAALVEAKGEFAWPRVRVTAGTLEGTAGERLQWHGGWDFATKEVLAAAAEGQIRRPTVARWLPAAVEFDTVALKADAAGPLAALRHTGRAQAEAVKFSPLNPLALMFVWAGRGAEIESFAAAATAGTTTISAEGAVNGAAVRLTKGEWVQGGAVRLRLTEPAGIRWRPALQLESLHLAGPESGVDASLAWGAAGRVDLAVKNLSSAWLSEFGVLRGPAWRVASLAAQGAWENGPMTFALNGTAAIELAGGASAVVVASARGDKGGLFVEELSVVEEGNRVVKAAGRVPLRISPGSARIAEFDPDGALALDVTTAPNATFWQQLAALTGFALKEPEAAAHVTGTWAHPQGTVRVRAARVSADATRFKQPMPAMDALEVELAGDVGEVRVERLAVKVEGQTVRARGRLPVTDGKWREFLEHPLAWVQRGTEAQIEVPDAELAALARFLPAWVAPKGRLQADVSYSAGALHGALRLHGAGTHPLGPLGVLQEINADVAFAGRRAELRSVTAESGGQIVTLSGTVELPDLAVTPGGAADGAAVASEALRFDLGLKGQNLPLVRQTGVLVRGDLDLKLTSPPSGAPRITGTVVLRESLFLSDLRSLLPGGTRTKSRLPPYFAVDIAPYEAWPLDVLVQGRRFLKLRTTLFNGLASAKIQLGGTLGNPIARGEVTIDEGVVKLPFASFAVQEGHVSLTPEREIEPQVWLVGTVRRLSHDLRMEASGPAAAPTLVFSSSPPLESGQVLLMVMTGEAPHDVVTSSDRQRMARLGTFLGQSVVASLGGESGAGDRLSLSTGENVSRQGRETYGIEYRLNGRWSLVGEYDEFDDFNAGVKWRVFSKGGTREEEKK